MEHILGQEWEIIPAGGATGEAFYARYEDQRLFLKRNSSPFLAVLSAEGIVPKLVWTKRLENGDVITAQQWLEGRELKPSEMNKEQVAKLLKKIHRSEPMVGMLSRLEKSPLDPETIFQTVLNELDEELLNLPEVQKTIHFLKKEVKNIYSEEKVVCHGDVNHNNWLLTEDNQLYLIDWDGAMIADPAIDLGMLLYLYIPEEKWQEWLMMYGEKLTDHLKLRMKWYVALQTLSSIQWHKNKNRLDEMNKWIAFLNEIM
ncbi:MULTISPECIES: phosphotransferase family protein [Neobacillus]|uniref:Phosphotransferase family protein n=2 Tax=Neobacillus TaxID=2675232 RepID=A0A6B3TSD9_9BACI|nr:MULTISPECIES: phosphotransferase family protein [Neobacillus]AIM15927.1 phosphotransferase [Bacillus sp. X1(2014)]MCD4839395.1 phosphotransferase family protein [Neobacillus sedimentimangrovi]MED3622784.1 phosphotransferase family protein [Neobacillus thermocopriae]MED3714220.1 phosphotransferase family protein [Neobacillus thermocopriae]NEX78627.1 phosphotransferase family protein [Neobacillus thermocopriae]